MSLFRKVIDWGDGFLRYNFFSKIKPLYPRVLIINLTYQCNSKCIMCNIWKMKPKKELSLKDWKSVLQNPVFKKIKQLTVSGGEAFLYQDYVKTVKMMINRISSLKRLVLNTNGFAPNVTENILKIADYCKLRKIKLAVTLSIDEIEIKHDEIRRVNGGFDRVMKVLNKLKKAVDNGVEINLSVASVLMKNNINDYEEIKRYFTNKDVNHNFQLIGFHKSYVNNLEEKYSLDFRNESKIKIIEFLQKMGRKTNFEAFYWNDMYKMYKDYQRRETPCVFLKDGLVLDSLGDVYYCLSTKPIGNFVKEKKSISEIYFDARNIEFRNNLWSTSCKYCNSGCDVTKSIAYDFKKYFVFRTKRLFEAIFNK